ncbi:fructose-2,6-bisphosphatase, TIGAR-like protein [Schizosaccharomyces osmophilus]|uniref:Fructose-2,6-bisphosphatase, TIGAR-like protein n=1 Tax=Schizosaccharomyces osmophilus TaxID=2545709 RepID=A0AAE9WC69_9SCHI|nr:fructose-2,6-bisphosphatase, TIGAR-like protein [Schizosaccharomyces osmophilus]WBW72537.1 fructose-2,6-bisphosphatase, TIGAR-like protein [Schizosaccharomyces osmophilus]
MKVFLIRHGQTEQNKVGILQGSVDTSLSETGQLQAKLLGSRLSSLDIDQIFCSSMKRCRETIRPLLELRPEIPIEYSDLIRERIYGELEGMNVVEAKRLMGTKHPDHYGEGFSSLKRRLVKFWEEQVVPLRGEKKCIVVLCHGGVINALRAHFMEEKGYTYDNTKLEKKILTVNTSITEVEVTPEGTGHIYTFGDAAHLESEEHGRLIV